MDHLDIDEVRSDLNWAKSAAGLAVIVVLVTAAIAGLYWYRQMHAESFLPNANPLAIAAPTAQAIPTPVLPAPPRAREQLPSHPLNDVISAESPTLAGSDAALIAELSRLSGMRGLFRLVRPASVARHIVATVDALPRRQVPPQVSPMTPIPGSLIVSRTLDGDIISADNGERYLPWIHLLTAIRPAAAAAAYRHFYPLFQQAYQELGYPKGYFNDRLVQVIDELLATPAVVTPLRIVEPAVMWRYVDPDLESLSAGQKMLLRMGVQNSAAVRSWIAAFRAKIA